MSRIAFFFLRYAYRAGVFKLHKSRYRWAARANDTWLAWKARPRRFRKRGRVYKRRR